jgi:hypothetical protein
MRKRAVYPLRQAWFIRIKKRKLPLPIKRMIARYPPERNRDDAFVDRF